MSIFDQVSPSSLKTPQHPAMKRGVRNLKNRKDVDTTFLCLSNSNSVYINTILEVIDVA